MSRHLLTGVMIVAIAASAASSAEEAPHEADEAGIRFFEEKVRPVLVKHCYDCHSAESGTTEGDLRVDLRAGIRAGGSRGPAVIPGDPQASLLLKAVSHADPDLQMPPKQERLPASVLADLKKWIEMGAPDPRDGESADPVGKWDPQAAREHWAYQPPVDHDVPVIGDRTWPRQDLDHFILARLEEHGLSPSPDAEPHVLLRRLYFDLVGLPPSPADLDEFLKRIAADGMDQALAEEVDALLSSTHFGERWGRHWLDVARFAESSGKEANISFPYAWRYRDYVIDSFNADVPIDRFLVEQIAGDLLPYESRKSWSFQDFLRYPKERARLLIATGFLAIGPKNLDEMNAVQFRADVIDEQIDTLTRAVIGSSVACARCHDHKFDPFSMHDYYALAGIFGSTKTYFGTAVSPANRVGGDPLPLPREAGHAIFHNSIPAERVSALKQELEDLKQERKDGMAAVRKAFAEGNQTAGIFTLRDALRIFWRSGAIEGQLEKVDEEGQPLPLAMGVLDRDEIGDSPLLERGDVAKPAEIVPRGFPAVIETSESFPVRDDQSGRLELARWLTDPQHPLTARVFVNRVWQHLLGEGLVRTVDNFGTTGELPSHPALLDHLAVRFQENGWSLKQMVRDIVLSRTYRQASSYDAAAFQQDPDNRLLWRASKRRLEAEAIRDAMLAASGELDRNPPEGSLVARVIGDRPISLIGLDKRLPADLDGSTHRSVYLPVIRDRLPDVLDLFDFAEPSLVTGDRETTNVPIQALYLMNSPFVHQRATAFAERLQQESSDPRQQVHHAFLRCFSRAPDEEEQARTLAFLQEERSGGANSFSDEVSPLTSFCQALFSTAEFRNLD